MQMQKMAHHDDSLDREVSDFYSSTLQWVATLYIISLILFRIYGTYSVQSAYACPGNAPRDSSNISYRSFQSGIFKITND
jgi:hypothetical protein